MGLTASAERMDRHLLPYIETVQSVYPDKLLARGRLCNMATEFLSVTRQAVSARIADAIASEKLIEIFPRADWMVTLPEGADLPRLFAVTSPVAKVAYDLLPSAPVSRGAGGVSFIITPGDLKELLSLTRERLDLPEPDGTEYYMPVIERRVRPDDYRRMKQVLLQSHTAEGGLAWSGDTLNEVLSVLRLNPPH